MKFVNIESAKGLTAGKEVYTLNENGEYGIARLASKTEDAKGTHFKFEVPQYSDQPLPVAPVIVEDITHVCIMKKREDVVEVESAKELNEALNGK